MLLSMVSTKLARGTQKAFKESKTMLRRANRRGALTALAAGAMLAKLS